jgi:hypothetical protein
VAEPERTASIDPWPKLDSAAFHGLAGEIVRAIEPETEADPTGVMLTFLTTFGNAVNSGPHAMADGSAHPARVYFVLVGRSGVSRKGTSAAHVRRSYFAADPLWSERLFDGGLSSGEGLIAAVRDGDGQDDLGSPDKRLLVLESEFARVLKVAAREGNTLSAVLRQAWDSGNLRVMTRKDPLKASGAHISIIAHITQEELLRRLTDTEMANGFANRFLFAMQRRSKLLPKGGNFVPGPFVPRIRQALTDARKTGRVERSPEAEERWDAIYRSFGDGELGLLGAITARADAQTLRLSVIYALLDGSNKIEIPHLEAAYAVWQFAEASAAYIFGDALGDPVADKLLEAIRAAGHTGLTHTQQRELFARHESGHRLDGVRNLLESRGLIETIEERTAGRPVKISRAAAPKARKALKAPPYGAYGAYGAPENGGTR